MSKPRCPECGSEKIYVKELSWVYWNLVDVGYDSYDALDYDGDGIWAFDEPCSADGSMDDKFGCEDCGWEMEISPESRRLLMGEKEKIE